MARVGTAGVASIPSCSRPEGVAQERSGGRRCIYGQDRGRYIVVASNGGAKSHPHWYRNLAADPHVFVQIAGERFEARARTATARSKPRLWRLMASIWPEYEGYQARTTREIPVVILERRN